MAGLAVTIKAARVDANVVALAAEALSNPNPPLAQEALQQIELLETARIDSLDGPDKFEAVKVFDLLRSLPPIEGPVNKKLFALLKDTDFSADALMDCVERLSSPDSREARLDEWGYMNAPAVTPKTGDRFNVSIDMRGAERKGIRLTVEIFSHLGTISDVSVRNEIIDDCAKIMDLRLVFDLTKLP